MERKNKKVKVALIIVSVIAVCAIATLSVFLGLETNKRTAYGADLENVYERAYYSLVANVNNMEISLSKLLVTTSSSTRIEVLNDITKNSYLAGEALSTLSAENYGVMNTTRYINQTGDFAAYLVHEVATGNDLDEEQRTIIRQLLEMTEKIGEELQKINSEIAKGDYNFLEGLSDDENIFNEVFMGLEENIVEYPALIYDGPFSAALLEKEAKGLSGEELSEEQGAEKISELLADFGVTEINFESEGNSFFPILTYNAKNDKGEDLSIQISKQGGQLVMLNVSKMVEEPSLSPEECAELAEQYLESMGYQNMKSVWVSNYNSTIYVNLAPIIDGIVWYPDLIKVKISSGDGELLGFEALSYIFNHTDRTLPAVSISESAARASLSTDITVETARLALIPYKDGSEKLTYEFSGRSGDALYYVYVDVASGEEVKVLRVIDSDEGTLLL